MRHDTASAAFRSTLMDNLKDRYEAGAGRQTLCQTSDISTFPPSSLKYEWLGYGGQGSDSFLPANEQVAIAAEELLAEGMLAPGLPRQYQGIHYKPVKLLEDLNWGLDKNDGIVLFELSPAPNIKDRVHPVGGGYIVREDTRYQAALREIRKRLDLGKAIKDGVPMYLNNEQVIYPVMFDRRMIELRKRQKEFNPE